VYEDHVLLKYDAVFCYSDLLYYVGTRGGAVGRGTALQAIRSRLRFPTVSLEFFIDKIPSALWPWV
jgi:hypothetical protein